VKELAEAIAGGQLGDRLWLYSNYHCNLECSYCLTDSAPTSPRRSLSRARMVELAGEAAALGFTSVGVTGGEPFLVPDMAETLAEMAAHLPVVVLSNGTLFTERLLARVAPLAGLPVAVQLSLDAADAAANDARRGDGGFVKVIAAAAALRRLGVRVRIASTGASDDAGDRARLCALHLELGIADEDHVTRPVVRRGRAAVDSAAVATSTDNLSPELTITADGAFWSPFAPTAVGGRVDTDLLVCRITSPLHHPVGHILRLVAGRLPGGDAVQGIP